MSCTVDWRFLRVLDAKLIDLEEFRGSGEVVQRALAAIAHHKKLFRNANTVVVERQPITGFQSVQAAFPVRFRGKCVFVSPSRVHAHFKTGHLSYDDRKRKMVACLGLHLAKVREFRRASRKHDMCDGLAVVLVHARMQREAAAAREEAARRAAADAKRREKEAAEAELRAARHSAWIACGNGKDISEIDSYRYVKPEN